MKEQLERLVRHMLWANIRTLNSLLTLSEPPKDAIRLFAHLVATEHLYLRRMRAEDPFPQDFWPALSLEEATRLAEENAALLAALVTERSEVELRRAVRYRNSKGTYFETPLEQMLLHLALHGEHHRGQIARIVREAGGEPAVTDLITFVREENQSTKIIAR